MARLVGPDEGSRLTYGIHSDNSLAAASDLTVTVYADAAGTQLADILTYPGGVSVSGSVLTVDANSLLPLIQYPDDARVVYAKANGGPVVPLYARTSEHVAAALPAVDVRDYGATGDGKRIRNVTASLAGTAVTVPSGSFTGRDVGKACVVYTDTAAGTITTIQSVQSATSITLAAAAGITVSGSTGYILYGSDNSAAFAAAFAAAAARASVDITVGPNQPMGLGLPTVIAPAIGTASAYVLTSAITVPSGVTLDCPAMLVNLLSDRYAPVLVANPWSAIRTLHLEAMFGTGIQLGTSTSQQAQIHCGLLELWHVGKTTEGSGLLRSQDAVTLLGYSFLIDLVWVKGGQTGIRHAAGSDAAINRAFIIGAHVGVSLTQSNQVHYSGLILDSCGETGGGFSGVTLNDACSDIDISMQAFCVVGVTRTLDSVVLVGAGSANLNKFLRLRIMAQVTGGIVLNLVQAQDIDAQIVASNTATPSSGGTAITTALVWGNVQGSCRVAAQMNTSIAPYSGTVQGIYSYTRGGVAYSVQGGGSPTGAAQAANGAGPPAVTVTGNDGRGKVSFGSGTGPAAGNQVVVTYQNSTGWIAAPFVHLTPLTAATATAGPYVAASTATTVTIAFANAPTASQSAGTYQVQYRIEG